MDRVGQGIVVPESIRVDAHDLPRTLPLSFSTFRVSIGLTSRYDRIMAAAVIMRPVTCR